MSAYTDVEQFLQVVFGSDWREKCFLCNSDDWRRKTLEGLDPEIDCYWCVGAIPWGKPRKNSSVEDIRALVFDDVGTKVPEAKVDGTFGRPTASVLTSPGNQQWTYRLSKPLAPDQWRGFFGRVEAKLQHKLDGKDAVHLFRLPMGVNTKADADA